MHGNTLLTPQQMAPPQITGPPSCINSTTKTNLILTSCLAIPELKRLIHLFAFHIYCCAGFITGL